MSNLKAERIKEQNAFESMMKVAENALRGAFQAGFNIANNGAKKNSFHFIEIAQVERAKDGSLIGIFTLILKTGINCCLSWMHLKDGCQHFSGLPAL